MPKIAYHVFRKQKKSLSKKKTEQKPFYRWYYYFVDATGKKIQKACPGCKNRSDAENYIRTLPPITAAGVVNPDLLIRDVAKEMYIPGSAHIDRRRQLGKAAKIETLADSRNYIDRIIKDFGDRAVAAVDADEVINYLFTVDRSGSWKNRYIAVFKEIFSEAPRFGCKVPIPAFPNFARNSKKADIFTGAELDVFFKPDNFPDFQLYTFFVLMLSAGLRLGEARAVRYKQIFFTEKLLIIDGFLKKDGNRTNYNKKGTPENPKFRAVWLPDLTLKILENHLLNTAIKPEDLIFITDEGRPLRQEFAENVFLKALIKAGFVPAREPVKRGRYGQGRQKQNRERPRPADGRKLVPHSLRYTYVSRMRVELSAEELQPMTGHTTEYMVDYYNRRNLEAIIKSLPKPESVNSLLDFTPAGV